MIKLFFKYTRGVILERVPLTAGTVGLKCSFEFSKEWSGLTKTAVFEGSGVARDVVLLESTVDVPPEVLEDGGGELRIGAYGMDDDGNIVIPTMYVDVGTILGDSVDPSKDPTTDGTLPVWGQVLNVALEAKEKAKNAEEAATGEKESAREYAEAAKAAKTDAETLQKAAQSNANSALTHARNAATAKTDAETAKEAAEAARDEAQAAKESIENMTVSAVTVAPGTDVSVAKSESDGKTHLEFSFPQADQANWDQEDSKSASFVKSKPSIKAGTGTHAIVEGKITGNGANVASGLASHAEGYNTQATNQMAHAEGGDTVASGSASHAEGRGTVANSNNQHVQGKFNDLTDSSKYAHIVGNGTGEDELNEDGTIKTKKRSNAHTLDWDGNAWFAGKVTVGTDNKELVTKAYVDESIENIEIDVDTEISDTSTNPVQNKVIKQYVDNSGGKSPYIGDNGNWFEWSEEAKDYVDTGVKAEGKDGKDGVSGLPDIVTASSERMFITRCASYTEYRNTSSVTSAGINVFYRNKNNPGNDMWAMTFDAGENISFMEPANEYQKIEWAVAEPVFTPGYTYYLSFIPLKDESYENDLVFRGTILGVWVAKELKTDEQTVV